MQAFCRHSTSRRRLAGQGPGRYIGQDGMDGPAGAGTTGRHGLWASCSCSYSVQLRQQESSSRQGKKAAVASDISLTHVQVRSEQRGAQATRSGRTVREREGCLHGFLEPRNDTPQRKSRRPKTNKTNGKVDNKAVGGHWEGQQASKRAPEGRR